MGFLSIFALSYSAIWNRYLCFDTTINSHCIVKHVEIRMKRTTTTTTREEEMLSKNGFVSMFIWMGNEKWNERKTNWSCVVACEIAFSRKLRDGAMRKNTKWAFVFISFLKKATKTKKKKKIIKLIGFLRSLKWKSKS